MDEIIQTQNLNAHYSTTPKVVKPKYIVVEGPQNVPEYHIYTDREANIKLEKLNNDVYEAVQRTPKKSNKKILGFFKLKKNN